MTSGALDWVNSTPKGLSNGTGLFTQPVHRAEKPWATALAEDRESVLLAEKLGFSEVWIGEHFSPKGPEQIPSPLMFLASLIEQTSTIRFAPA
ncbi:MAG: hypothetical protein CM1200mP41_07510 [Gammaproteobacteria bacterium]|nr:MAG: hypothetical protein CM1200mP41_07510 [Gammaproteobacteria bacterium]